MINDNVPETEDSPSSLKIKEMYFNCTECSSPIDIINISKKELSIEFKCINNNHKRKLLIKEYLDKMKKFSNVNINCDKCQIHNLQYECFCLDCNIHLCKECLKLRNHINHFKNIIIEVQPNKKELQIIEDIIKNYANKIEYLTNEKYKKTKDIKIKFNKYKNKLIERKNIKAENNKKNMEKELKTKKDKYILDIEKKLNLFLKEMKHIKNQYEIEINEINNKYKLKNEYEDIQYKKFWL